MIYSQLLFFSTTSTAVIEPCAQSIPFLAREIAFWRYVLWNRNTSFHIGGPRSSLVNWVSLNAFSAAWEAIILAAFSWSELRERFDSLAFHTLSKLSGSMIPFTQRGTHPTAKFGSIGPTPFQQSNLAALLAGDRKTIPRACHRTEANRCQSIAVNNEELGAPLTDNLAPFDPAFSATVNDNSDMAGLNLELLSAGLAVNGNTSINLYEDEKATAVTKPNLMSTIRSGLKWLTALLANLSNCYSRSSHAVRSLLANGFGEAWAGVHASTQAVSILAHNEIQPPTIHR